jgi:hypothetical protein
VKGIIVIFIFITGLLCGCTTPQPSSSGTATAPADPSDKWIKGTLTCLESGTALSFRIQKKMAWGGSATGGVVAINPTTNERFSGQYTGMMESGHINSSATATAWGSGGYATGSATGFTRWQSEMANAAATLNDQKGTVIQLRMQIHAGWSPHGIGDGIDNHGNHYQVQF